MARVKNADIHVMEMKDGEVSVITRWPHGEFIGRVVQRYQNSLISIGMYSLNGWGQIWELPENEMEGCYVRILEEGTEIIL